MLRDTQIQAPTNKTSVYVFKDLYVNQAPKAIVPYQSMDPSRSHIPPNLDNRPGLPQYSIPVLLAPKPAVPKNQKHIIKAINYELHASFHLLKACSPVQPLPTALLETALKVEPDLHPSLPSFCSKYEALLPAHCPFAALPCEGSGKSRTDKPLGLGETKVEDGGERRDTLEIRAASAAGAMTHVVSAHIIISAARGRLDMGVKRHHDALIAVFEGLALWSLGRVDEARVAFVRGCGVRDPAVKELNEGFCRMVTRSVRRSEMERKRRGGEEGRYWR